MNAVVDNNGARDFHNRVALVTGGARGVAWMRGRIQAELVAANAVSTR
jgi:hypothetical protein